MKKLYTYMLVSLMVLSSLMSGQIASAVKIARPFSVLVGDTPSKIDPADAFDSVSINVVAQVFEGLYKYDLTGDMASIPNLAKEMGNWSEDMLKLTIKLREDVFFHDGTPFNATVVKWNFDRLMAFVNASANTPAVLYVNDVLLWNETVNITTKEYKLHYQPILKETVIDNNFQVTFVLNKPWTVWEQLLAFSGSFILKPNEKYLNEFLTTDDIADAIGTGPFKIVSIVPHKKTTFENTKIYRLGAANITDMIYEAIAEGDSASRAFLAHDYHYGSVTPDFLTEAQADEAITIQIFKSSTVFYLQMNVYNVPFDARKAMAFSFNYTNYLEQSLANQSFPLHTPIPDGMLYHNASIEGLPYLNLTLARSFLLKSIDTDIAAHIATNNLTVFSTDEDWIAAANGTTPVCTFNFTRYASSGLDRFYVVMIDSFRKIGFKIINYVVGDWCGGWCDYDYYLHHDPFLELTFGGWGPDYNDPINMMEPIYKTNASYNDCRIANSTLDSMMEQYYTLTGAAQEQVAWDIQKMIAVDICPSIYLYQRGGGIMYLNEFVSNVDDNLNIIGNWHWYNVHYQIQFVKPFSKFNGTLLFTSVVLISGCLVISRRLLKFLRN